MRKASWVLLLILIGAMIAGCDSVSNVLPIKSQPTPTPVPPLAPAQQYASANIQVAIQAPVHFVINYPVSITQNAIASKFTREQAAYLVPAGWYRNIRNILIRKSLE